MLGRSAFLGLKLGKLYNWEGIAYRWLTWVYKWLGSTRKKEIE